MQAPPPTAQQPLSPDYYKMTRRGPSPLLAGLLLLAVCAGAVRAQQVVMPEYCATSNAVTNTDWTETDGGICTNCLRQSSDIGCADLPIPGTVYECKVGGGAAGGGW